MLLIITKGERQFIVDVLQECIRACDDVEEAAMECIEILESLDLMDEAVYEE